MSSNFKWPCKKCYFSDGYLLNACNTCNKQIYSQSGYLRPCATVQNIDDIEVIDDVSKNLKKAKTIRKNLTCGVNPGEKFVDYEFPPDLSSIGKTSLFSKRSETYTSSFKEPVVWLRPQDLRGDEYSNEKLLWAVIRNPSCEDIVQGRLGNCWLLTGLSLIADRSELLNRILITKDIDPIGIYQVQLCKDGVWTIVTIDDLFPADKFNQMVYSRANRKQLWVSLIEKAAAKLYGSYEALSYGYCADGLSTLTGFPCETIRLAKLNKCNNEDFLLSEQSYGPVQTIHFENALQENDTVDTVWAKLLSAKEANFVMCASCGSQNEDKDFVAQLRTLGLSNLHAYAILDVRDVPGVERARLIRLKNPWARLTWKGEWSDGHESWSRLPSSIRDELQPLGVSGESCGVFWIGWADLLRYFFAIDICWCRGLESGTTKDKSWSREMRIRSHFPWPVWTDWSQPNLLKFSLPTTSSKTESEITFPSGDGSSNILVSESNNAIFDHEFNFTESVTIKERAHSPIPDIEKNNTCVVVTVLEPSMIQFVLWQSINRFKNEKPKDLLLIVVKGYGEPIGNIVARSPRLTSSYVMCDKFLDPGVYTVFYFSFHHWQNTVQLETFSSMDYPCLDFPPPRNFTQSMCTLSIHPSKPVLLQRAVLTPSMIPHVLFELVVQKGRLQMCGDLRVYTLLNDFSGIIVLIVNPNNSRTIRCGSDFNGCVNLINSRGRQFWCTDDIVFPGYAQITNLLTQDDPFSSVSLQHKQSAVACSTAGSKFGGQNLPYLAETYPQLQNAPDTLHWPPIQLIIHKPLPLSSTSLSTL